MQIEEGNEVKIDQDSSTANPAQTSSKAANWAAVSLATLCLSLPLGSCGQSDAEYLEEARVLRIDEDHESLRAMLDMRVQLEVSGFEKIDSILAQQSIYERQYVFGPHYDFVDGGWEVGWHWDDVKVGEKTVEVGAWYRGVEDSSNIQFRAQGNNYPQSGDFIVAGDLSWSSDRGCYVIEDPHFISHADLER